MNKIFQPAKLGKPALGFLLTALLLFLSVAGASPSLHKLIHADAGSPEHNCVISLFAKGQVNSTTVTALTVVFVALFGGVALLAETFLLPSANYRFSASRAPPSSLV